MNRYVQLRIRQPRFPRSVAQRGAVLIVALIFLVLLTLLAIGASSGSLLQQRMVAATRSAQLATMSGDTALRGAEWQLWSTTAMVSNSFPCDATDINATTGCVKYDPASPLYAPGGTVTTFRTGDNAWLASGLEYKGAGGTGYTGFTGTAAATANIAENPRYIIEDMGRVKPPGAGPQCESGTTGCNPSSPGSIKLDVYRITARATGGNQNTVRVVESTFDAQASD